MYIRVLYKYLYVFQNNKNNVLFVDSLSTDCARFVDRHPAFRPAEVARHMY